MRAHAKSTGRGLSRLTEASRLEVLPSPLGQQLVRLTIPLLMHMRVMTESARLIAAACKTACVAEPDRPLRGSLQPCGRRQ